MGRSQVFWFRQIEGLVTGNGQGIYIRANSVVPKMSTKNSLFEVFDERAISVFFTSFRGISIRFGQQVWFRLGIVH